MPVGRQKMDTLMHNRLGEIALWARFTNDRNYNFYCSQNICVFIMCKRLGARR